MTVRETETPGVFFVGYWVNLRPGEESCDCAAGCYGDRVCLHVKAAREYQSGEVVKHWRTR